MVKVLRHQVYERELRGIVLALMIHITQSGFPIKQHKASVIGILRVVLVDDKIGVK